MKWTLITGGAKRLGAALCLELAKRGFSILVHYCKSEDEALKVANECRNLGVAAEIIQGDFSSQAATHQFIHSCLTRFADIENLINNVGNYLIKSAANTSSDEWNSLFQTNLHAPFALSQAFLPALIKNRGSIINIGIAGVANHTADTKYSAYRISKGALWLLTKSLAKELAPKDVCVNMVSPGYLENAIDLPDTFDLPMRRPAALQEVTRVVAFLLEKESHYITGQNIEVSGGIRL